MLIFIPTRGRVSQQITWNYLPPSLRSQACLVCPPEEVPLHQAAGRTAYACPVSGIAAVRQWILDQSTDPYCFMLDDDLRLYRRSSEDSWALKTLSRPDPRLEDLFARLCYLLQKYPHVGVSSRPDSFRYFPEKEVYGVRIYNFHGFNRSVLRKHGVGFRNGPPVMEDFNVALQLLLLGYNNALVTDWAWGQAKSGIEGGCSFYRNYQVQRDAALWLARQYPNIVKAVVRETRKENWSGVHQDGRRVDVAVSWRKAREIGEERRNLRRLF